MQIALQSQTALVTNHQMLTVTAMTNFKVKVKVKVQITTMIPSKGRIHLKKKKVLVLLRLQRIISSRGTMLMKTTTGLLEKNKGLTSLSLLQLQEHLNQLPSSIEAIVHFLLQTVPWPWLLI